MTERLRKLVLKICAAIAGSASTTCARSATARGCAGIGYDADDWTGKPVIGIINTWSDINPCHAHLRARAENVKRGVLQAGGFPIELPAMSLAETFVKPTTMLYRNMLAMETEELLRSHPIDGAVLMGGCDKTTPGLIMGAISMGIPAIYVPAGPMLRGNWRGRISRLRLRRLEILDREARRQHHRRGMERDRRRHRPLVRHLHGDGHGGDHDGDRRSARPVAARRLVDPGRRCQSSAHVRRRRPAHRRHGVGGSDAARRSSPPPPSTTPSRCTWRWAARPTPSSMWWRWRAAPALPMDMETFDQLSRADAGARQCAAVGQIPDGGFLLRRRPARADAELAREARSLLPHRHRQDRGREHRRRQGLHRRRHPLAQRSGLRGGRHRGAQGQSRAATAASSSRPPPTSASSSIAARRSPSRTTTT